MFDFIEDVIDLGLDVVDTALDVASIASDLGVSSVLVDLAIDAGCTTVDEIRDFIRAM